MRAGIFIDCFAHCYIPRYQSSTWNTAHSRYSTIMYWMDSLFSSLMSYLSTNSVQLCTCQSSLTSSPLPLDPSPTSFWFSKRHLRFLYFSPDPLLNSYSVPKFQSFLSELLQHFSTFTAVAFFIDFLLSCNLFLTQHPGWSLKPQVWSCNYFQ